MKLEVLQGTRLPPLVLTKKLLTFKKSFVMDITAPPLEQQVEPAPWLIVRRNVDALGLIDQILQNQPGVSADEVVDKLAEWHIPANGTLVAQRILEIQRMRRAGQIPHRQEFRSGSTEVRSASASY